MWLNEHLVLMEHNLEEPGQRPRVAGPWVRHWVTVEQRIIKGPLHVIRVAMHVWNAQLLVKQNPYAISRLTPRLRVCNLLTLHPTTTHLFY
jgi:hypothetical protein